MSQVLEGKEEWDVKSCKRGVEGRAVFAVEFSRQTKPQTRRRLLSL